VPSVTPALAEETRAPDEAAVTAALIAFLKAASARRYPAGVMRRFNQGRHTGCADAEFAVRDDLPAEHRVGVFAVPRTYHARLRFANASSGTDRERDIRGMSIKVFDVDGDNLTAGARTQDFILNSHPVMVAPNSKEFLALLQAMEAGGLARARYFLTHPTSAFIGFSARQNPPSHLDIPFWSTTPYLFGPGRAVKYIARPCSPRKRASPSRLTDTYLRDAMEAHLAQSDACFDFMIQFQTDSRRMPIENAMVEWKERDSPYRAVARIRIPQQAINDPDREIFCEQVSFNPWNCLVDHRPLGDFNRARRVIYQAMAEFRDARTRLLTGSEADRTPS
jgi:hypothetical protein